MQVLFLESLKLSFLVLCYFSFWWCRRFAVWVQHRSARLGLGLAWQHWWKRVKGDSLVASHLFPHSSKEAGPRDFIISGANDLLRKGKQCCRFGFMLWKPALYHSSVHEGCSVLWCLWKKGKLHVAGFVPSAFYVMTSFQSVQLICMCSWIICSTKGGQFSSRSVLTGRSPENAA